MGVRIPLRVPFFKVKAMERKRLDLVVGDKVLLRNEEIAVITQHNKDNIKYCVQVLNGFGNVLWEEDESEVGIDGRVFSNKPSRWDIAYRAKIKYKLFGFKIIKENLKYF